MGAFPALDLPPACSATVSAHKFHASFTQMEFNRQEKSVEIAIRLFSDDFTEILSRRAGKHISLDVSKEAEKAAFAYVSEKLEIKNRQGVSLKPVWVGMEPQVDTTWVYLEIPLADGFSGATIRNQLFFDLFEDQTNVIGFKESTKKADLIFSPGDTFKPIPDLH
ncbi:MAG: hypothetical protein K1Y36_18110 [Blastocatellia bacterium]|nr:hypothetical protein [Blastocatellia bacterium]